MKTDEISNNQDVIDSRDIIARIEELESEQTDLQDTLEEAKEELESLDEEETNQKRMEMESAAREAEQALKEFNDDYGEELKVLKSIADECEGYGDWSYGEILINEEHFEDYARELAEDIGAIPKDSKWPCTCIDWEQAAEELKADYTSVDFNGTTYYMRT
jgi:chromosome segregation ATPase